MPVRISPKPAKKSGKSTLNGKSSSSASWLLNQLKSANKSKTVAIVAHQSDVTSGALDDILPGGANLTKSKEFLDDLKMSSNYWFYSNAGRRVVLMVKTEDKSSKDTRAGWRQLGAATVGALQSKKITDVQVIMTKSASNSADSLGVFQNAVALSNYDHAIRKAPVIAKDEDPRVKKNISTVGNIQFSVESQGTQSTSEVVFQNVCANATTLTRNLANARGSVGTPDWMEAQVHKIAKKGKKGVKEVRVLDAKDLQRLKMNLFYNVGKGADSQPRCVIVHYVGNPSKPKQVDIAFVGKGVTYDTGGLNLKPTGGMEDMYGDKGGACAVIGALQGTMELGLKKNIIFACGFADNAIGPSCYKPGDILESMNGLHVEIGNTDAEGRLVMADTMTYVQQQFKPDRMINIATLTGACMVALGVETAGVFSEDDQMVRSILDAGKDSFEPCWHLPIMAEHKEGIKSRFADISNMGKSRMGGASTAAAFLLRFVDEGVQWAHIDIAGPAVRSTAKAPACADQTGFGCALLLQWLRTL